MAVTGYNLNHVIDSGPAHQPANDTEENGLKEEIATKNKKLIN
jgi:hypothetical protein